MGLNLENVPEKGHFTIAEIAERWEVDDSVVEYFIMEKGLRLATYTRELPIEAVSIDPYPGDSFFDMIIEAITYLIESPNKINTVDYGEETSVFNSKKDAGYVLGYDRCITKSFSLASDFPKYLYITSDKMLPAFCAETFDGKTAVLISSYLIDVPSNCYFDIEFAIVQKKAFKYITKEERNRFELEYDISNETGDAQLLTESDSIVDSDTTEIVRYLDAMIKEVTAAYPVWKESVGGMHNIKNVDNLEDFIYETAKANSREASTREMQMIKKGMIEKFPELKRK